ncbi:FMRFamide receptor-like [Lineus longissimus]|uniref:FMRFamide receptor-like n=1 Tax=Lineus longissimus TaxID=88925 RepID=UPI002B4F8264
MVLQYDTGSGNITLSFSTPFPTLDQNGSNNTNTLPDGCNDDCLFKANLDKIFAILTIVITPPGLLGNILTITVLTHKSMRSSTNNYLCALAIWDTVVILTALHLISLYILFPTLTYAVPFVYPVGLTAQTATIWITVSFTVERYIAVCHPLKATSMCTIRRARVVLGCVTICSWIYNLPRWFEYTLDVPPGIPAPMVTTEFGKNIVFKEIYFIWLYLPVMCIIPLSVLAVLNVFLVRAVRESQRQRSDMNVRQSRENNVTIMLVSVVVVFIICQVPALVYNVAYAINQDDVNHVKSYFLLSSCRNYLVVVNSTVNFLLYCAFGQKFRRTFIRIICPCCLTDGIGRQHSFSHASNQGHGAGQVRTHAKNRYFKIPTNSAGKAPQTNSPQCEIDRQGSHKNTTLSSLSSNELTLSTVENKQFQLIRSADDHFSEVTSKPIAEEYEMSDLHIASDTEIEHDADSQDTVLRHLISDKDSFCIYRVDFKKMKNGVVI